MPLLLRSFSADSNRDRLWVSAHTLCHELKKSFVFEEVPPEDKNLSYLQDLVDGISNFTAIESFANSVYENYVRRQLIHIGEKIVINSEYSEAYNNLGAAYQDLSNNEEALKNFQKAIKIKPNYNEAYNNLGMIVSDFARFY